MTMMLNPIVKRCAGLDVHKMTVVATVLAEQDDGSIQEQTRQFGTFRKHRRQLVRWLKRFAVELAIMESTGIYWKSIYASLEEAAITTYVVNARYVKNVPGRKTDMSDSQWLAILGRAGLLKPSFIPPKDFRDLRLFTRRRAKVKSDIAAEINRMHKMLDDAGLRLGGVVSDIRGVAARKLIKGLIEGKAVKEMVPQVCGKLKKKIPQLMDVFDDTLSPKHQFLLQTIDHHITYLEEELAKIDKFLIQEMAPYKQQLQILQTIPGIDLTGAITILVEIGIDMDCFGSSDRLASWAGICPGNNESAGKKKSAHTRKGNRAIRKVLCEVANAAIRTTSQFSGQYKSLVIRRGHKRTIFAVGHKILRIIFALLKTLKPYKDPGIDYTKIIVDRNAPRWLAALKKYGYLPELAQAAA